MSCQAKANQIGQAFSPSMMSRRARLTGVFAVLDFGCVRIFPPRFVEGVLKLRNALETDDRTGIEDRGEELVTELGAERLDAPQPVHRDRRVDDPPDPTVAGFADLVDELFLVRHHHTRLPEAGVEHLDGLGGGQHIVVAGEIPRSRRGAAHRAVAAQGGEVGRLRRRGQRIEVHARIVAPITSRAPLARHARHPVASRPMIVISGTPSNPTRSPPRTPPW